ncbi:hypothetical protein L0337_30455 [candidate division KSB1 bacterium]|nr:hypothetical protein [candidate division KSB1 bacterium]
MPCLVAALFCFDAFSFSENLLAQQEKPLISADSSAASWSASSVTYEIDQLRLRRWLEAHQDTAAVEFWAQVLALQQEANTFATQQDYVTAQLILDTALELIGLRGAAVMPLMAPDSERVAAVADSFSASPSSSLEWRREVMFGADLWRQEFDLGLAADNSSYIDRDGNPFAGLRISLNRNPLLQPLTQKSQPRSAAFLPESRALSFSAYAMLKSSRDYYSGELEFSGRQAVGSRTALRFQMRLDGTSYRRNLDLHYWQNTTSAVASAEVGKNFRLEIGDEMRFRRYRRQSELYPNYIQNQASVGAIFNSSYTTRLDSRYSFIARIHDSCPVDDYVEHRVDASIFQSTANNSAVLLENIWRHRIYPTEVAEGCPRTYQNTFQEEYARADLRLGLSEAMALRVEGDFTLRQHQTPSDSTPDFLSTTVNPQLQFKLLADWQISVGYLYLLRVYDKDIIRSQRPATVAGELGYSFYEDYYSHGFTLGVDLIRTDGVWLSVNENFEMRTYPNAIAQDLPGFGLYSDRNINSLLLFFSWNFLPRWQAGVLANFDNDHSRIENQSDSRNTLFSIDLGYSF